MKISFPFNKRTATDNSPFASGFAPRSSSRLSRLKLPNKKLLLYLGAALVVVLIVFLFKASLSAKNNTLALSSSKVNVKNAKATQNINKEINIPIKNDKGAEITNIKYLIQSAELRDEIVVKGQKGTAVAGRSFLVLNLKLVNDYNKAIEVNTKDFVRLSVNGSSEWLAPDIHNDPVSVQAISTKYTRVGFPVNDTDKSFKLQVGEINGEKQVVDLNF